MHTATRPHPAGSPLGLGELQAGRRGSAHPSPGPGARSSGPRARGAGAVAAHSPSAALGVRGRVTPSSSEQPGSLKRALALARSGTREGSRDSRKPVQTGRGGDRLRGAPRSAERGAHRPVSSRRCRGHCALPAPIAQRGSYLARVRVQAAVVPGFQEARPGPPQRAPLPRMLPAALDEADCPSLSLRALPGRFPCWPPAGGAPTPSRPTPHSHLGKGTGKRLLVSSPHSACGRVLNSPRLITEHLISALPQRGRGDAWEFLFTPFRTGLRANHKQTGTQPAPPPASPPSAYLATSVSPPPASSFPSFLPSFPPVLLL